MKVLLVTHSYDPEVTAPQRRWSAFVSEFRRRGWDVDIVAPVADRERTPHSLPRADHGRPWRRETGRHGERVLRVPLLPHWESRASKLVSNLATSLLTVPWALCAGRPDVVLVTVPALPNIAAGYVLSRLWRRPLTVDMRDAWPDLARDAHLVAGARPGIMESVVGVVQRRAELVVTVTEGFAEVLRSRGARRVAFIPNGILAARMPRVAEPGPRSADEPQDQTEPLHVLYLGNHGESQGLEVLIDAALLAGDDVRLRLVGTGTRKQALIDYARSVGADVEFLPATHGEGTMRQYDWADSAVVTLRDDWPSFEHTIPSKTYELLAVGVHITAAVRGEAADLLREAGSADVVPFDAAAIARLWSELRHRPGAAATRMEGRRWVAERRNLGLLAADFAELIQELGRADGPSSKSRSRA